MKHEYTVEENTARLVLSKGLILLIDIEDLERVNQYRWTPETYKKKEIDSYKVRSLINNKRCDVGRFILNENNPKIMVTAFNNNFLDNRKSNLKRTTMGEIRKDKEWGAGSSTGITGVYTYTDNGITKYRANIMRDGVKKQTTFPYTPQGLIDAKNLVETWKNNPELLSERSVQNFSHDINFVPTIVETTKNYPDPNTTLSHSQYYIDGNIVHFGIGDGYETLIDLEDLSAVSKHNWRPFLPKDSSSVYVRSHIKGQSVFLHRFVMNASDEKLPVDHIHHNTLDNRKSQLKITTNQENNMNRAGPYITNKSGIRGVSRHKKSDGNYLWVFRCHCVTCKIAKYFAYSELGLQEAKIFAEDHYSKINQEQIA